jgi:hypothetical protein
MVDDQYLIGDWNGDGRDGVGLRRGDRLLLKNDIFINSGRHDMEFGFGNGNSEDEYFVWRDGGQSCIGIRRGNQLYFSRSDGTVAAISLGDGMREDQYLIGDWDGDGRDGVGVRRGATILLKNDILDDNGRHDVEFGFGNGSSEDEYFVWMENGRACIGLRRGGQLFFRRSNGSVAEVSYGMGNQEDQYLIGDWDGDGRDGVGIRRGASLLLKNNILSNNGRHDIEFGFGNGNSEDEYFVWRMGGQTHVGLRRVAGLYFRMSDGSVATIGYGGGIPLYSPFRPIISGTLSYFVLNDSMSDVYVKPENGNTPQRVRPGEVYRGRVDGLTIPSERPGQVLKTRNFTHCVVQSGNQVDCRYPIQPAHAAGLPPAAEWNSRAPDPNWNEICDTSGCPHAPTGDGGSSTGGSADGHGGHDRPEHRGVIHDAPRNQREDVGRIA